MRSLFLMDEQAGLLTIKDKILYGLVVLFLVTFYAPHIPAVNNIVVALISLYSFFYNSFTEKFDLLRRRKEIILIVLFYLQHIISALVSKDQAEGFSWVILRLPLLVFPITIGLMYIKQALKERVIYAYAVITTLTILICMVYAFIQYALTGDETLLYNDNLTILTEKQSIYIALMVNLAIFSFGYLVSTNVRLVAKRPVVYSAVFILLLANFLMASRVAIITLFISIFCFAVWYAVTKKRWAPVIALVVGVGTALLVLVNYFPKTASRFKELEYTHYNYTNHGEERHFNMDIDSSQWNGANIRLAVWSCGWELVKQHPLLGVQLGDKVNEMMKVYASKKFDFAYKSRRNLHNNYLDVLVAFGITGLLLLLGFMFIPLIKSIRTGDYFGGLVILSFMLSFIPETWFDRSMGNMIFSFFVSFVISYRPPVTK